MTMKQQQQQQQQHQKQKMKKQHVIEKVWFVIFIGIIFHCVFLWSIFDIYFRSPLVHGMRHFKPNSSGHAKRIVFIVADGLRADKFFEIPSKTNTSVAPFLRNIIENEGCWGISHTRVPTESRPGHVAMIAGFYEDVSAVTTGWKENPVEFDSVFNQSNFVLQIGSPDVVNIFKGNNIISHSYPAEMEDFASGNPSSLDRWVFHKLEELLLTSGGTIKEELEKKMKQQENVIIFLHLLGIDTAGHAYRPNNDGYLDAITTVDEGVKRTVQIMEEYFQDNETTYIFTADHGMTTRGSHGDGDPECTRTPLVVWGKTVRRPVKDKASIIYDGSMDFDDEISYVKEMWRLDADLRKDIRQADLAPLMAAILGGNYPVNNVGTVPLNYLGVSEEHRTLNLYTNALQISEQFQMKEKLKKIATPLFFKPFEPLFHSKSEIVDNIESSLRDKNYQKAQAKCYELIEKSLDGLKYYQTYDWTLLMITVVCAYVSWMCYVLIYSVRNYTSLGKQFPLPSSLSNHVINFLTLVGLALAISYFYIQTSPIMYHIYALFPLYFFNQCIKEYRLILKFFTHHDLQSHIFIFLCYFVALEIMVIGYFRREIFSSCFIFLGIVPGLFDILPSFHPRLIWLINCILMSFFTLLPPDYGSDTRLVVFGGILLAAVEWYRMNRVKGASLQQKVILYFQVFLLLLSTYLVYSTDQSLLSRNGLPHINQILSWSVSIISLFIPILSGAHYKIRMSSLIMGFGVILIHLSVAYEVLFYACFDICIYLWIRREVNFVKEQEEEIEKTNREEQISSENLLTAVLFIFFINVAFFGTGNLATIASFEISSVYRYMTVFDPFAMGAMLLLKLAIPLLLVAIAFSVIMKVTKTSAFGVFFLVLAFFDVMTLNFFFLVRDDGSWMEIGNSISRFAIVDAMIIIILLLFGISQLLTMGLAGGDSEEAMKKHKSN